MYNPHDHYWLREDRTLYSSRLQADIHDDDVGYQAWLGQGGVPTPYPRDERGAESAAELAAVLSVYGLSLYLPGLGEVRYGVVSAINAAFESACAALLTDEPPSASATYATQEAEAEAYTRTPSAATPMLDTLAAVRGIPKAELVERVLRKAGLYKQAAGLLLGQHQRLMDLVAATMADTSLDDAAKIAALRALPTHIGLPGGES